MVSPSSPLPGPVYRSRKGRILPVVEEESAGGLAVKRVDDQICAAVIHRRNRNGRLEWCLPKGHLEPGESAPEAAAREIFEETGVQGRVICYLSTMDYYFTGSNRRVHKVVHHFLLDATGGFLTTENDPDGEAEEVAFLPLAQLDKMLAFPSEKRIARIATNLLRGR